MPAQRLTTRLVVMTLLFGLLAGKGEGKTFAEKVRSLVPDGPLHEVTEALLRAWEAINKEVTTLSRRLVTEARQDDTVCRLMTAPGVGVLVALVSTIGDPARFPHSSSVGAYVGLTPRRFQSGETDYTGKISRCGDWLTRTYLYEAGGIILNRVSRWSTLKAWGTRLARKIGHKKATVAVARKLAAILHRMWRDGTEFRWSTKEAAVTAP